MTLFFVQVESYCFFFVLYIKIHIKKIKQIDKLNDKLLFLDPLNYCLLWFDLRTSLVPPLRNQVTCETKLVALWSPDRWLTLAGQKAFFFLKMFFDEHHNCFHKPECKLSVEMFMLQADRYSIQDISSKSV